MSAPRCSPDRPLAILSFHSHSDRSFLDDRELATLSGALRSEDIANDLVLTVITREMEGSDTETETEQRLAEILASYDPIVYERVWNPSVIARLKNRLPSKTFIGLRGEHEMLEQAPADIFCNGEPKQALGPLVEWLRGVRDVSPAGTLLRDSAGRWQPQASSVSVEPRSFEYNPNLRPVVVNPEFLPASRTFSVTGNEGCPYQRDARDNPLYRDAAIPEHLGRGCAFCTTGNHYVARPDEDTAASVFEQIQYVRRHAPDLTVLVLKDQNPFGYLTEVIERCESEGVGAFTLLLETRAEWFLRSAARFDRALEVARRIDARIAPFLVGIENFSQPELDRFNKGISVATNIEFLETLWKWKDRHGETLDLSHAAFGFILFSPWTAMSDLETNLAGIVRTGFDRLRGSILLSRARLYPDTALYYLAERDGLLADEFESESDDASRRYGYYPSRPWIHANPEVAHFATLATAVAERNHSRDMVSLFEALLEEFRSAGDEWRDISVDSVWKRYQQHSPAEADPDGSKRLRPADTAFRSRFEKLIRPLSLESAFARGWRFAGLSTCPGRVQVDLRHADGPRLSVELVPRGQGPHFRRSRHYNIRATGRELTAAQRRALETLADTIRVNDA